MAGPGCGICGSGLSGGKVDSALEHQSQSRALRARQPRTAWTLPERPSRPLRVMASRVGAGGGEVMPRQCFLNSFSRKAGCELGVAWPPDGDPVSGGPRGGDGEMTESRRGDRAARRCDMLGELAQGLGCAASAPCAPTGNTRPGLDGAGSCPHPGLWLLQLSFPGDVVASGPGGQTQAANPETLRGGVVAPQMPAVSEPRSPHP